jgi:hypothetical protein
MVKKIRRTMFQSVAALLMMCAFQVSAFAEGPDLIQMLTSQLGVTGEQATGGAGAIFEYAKDNLDAEDFASIAKGVPGMDDMIAMAPEPENSSAMGEASSALSGAGGGLGGFDKSLGGLAGLASSFESLGLNADMVSQFAPIVSDYVGSVSGADAMSLLQGLF